MMFPTPSFVERISADLRRDLLAFLPELILCGTIVAMLLARLVTRLGRAHLGVFALFAGAAALVAALAQWPAPGSSRGLIPDSGGASGFSGLLVFDLFGLYLRAFLLLF